MSAFPALVLAVVLTYALGDIYRPHLPKEVAYVVHLLLCVVIFRVTHKFLRHLKG